MPVYSYTCADFPGMEACPGRFHAETEDELWQHIALHARHAHQEDVDAWPPGVTAQVKALIEVEPVMAA